MIENIISEVVKEHLHKSISKQKMPTSQKSDVSIKVNIDRNLYEQICEISTLYNASADSYINRIIKNEISGKNLYLCGGIPKSLK